MINLLLGAPGGGKSYEALVYHIIPALEKGRKVITNLALEVEALEHLITGCSSLIEIRSATLAERPVVDWNKAESNFKRFGIAARNPYFSMASFSHVEDFGDPWRHPKNGTGPLYVIDECHLSLPAKSTPVPVEEWFSLHRHEFADVLLITQSYGKVNRAIVDLVQTCYRVRKNIAFGSSKSYVRKVQDGVRGEVMNTSIRRYRSEYFKFYKSHTKSTGAGEESGASDITPIWRHWSFMGAGAFLGLFLILLLSGVVHNPFKPQVKVSPLAKAKPPVVVAQNVQQQPQTVINQQVVPEVPRKEEKPSLTDPFGAFGVHLLGMATFHGRTKGYYTLSQNGQRLKDLTQEEVEGAGYRVKNITICLAELDYQEAKRMVFCDAPTATAGVGGGLPVRSQSVPVT